MATTISTQDIIDAKRDIDDIGKAVNEKVIVSPRYGEDFKSLPMISAEFQISSDAAEAAAVTAVSAAQSASSSANIAEAAATAATIGAGVFETPESGVDPVTGVADGAYFNVRSSRDESYIDEYQNVGGVPAPSGKSYPSAGYVQNVADFTALPFVTGKTYGVGKRVQLNNGDIVKSTIDGNANDPNVDMTGWIKPQASGIFDKSGLSQQGVNDLNIESSAFNKIHSDVLSKITDVTKFGDYYYFYTGSLPHTVTESNPTSQYRCVGMLNGYPLNHVKNWGIVGDGTDQATKFQFALENAPVDNLVSDGEIIAISKVDITTDKAIKILGFSNLHFKPYFFAPESTKDYLFKVNHSETEWENITIDNPDTGKFLTRIFNITESIRHKFDRIMLSCPDYRIGTVFDMGLVKESGFTDLRIDLDTTTKQGTIFKSQSCVNNWVTGGMYGFGQYFIDAIPTPYDGVLYKSEGWLISNVIGVFFKNPLRVNSITALQVTNCIFDFCIDRFFEFTLGSHSMISNCWFANDTTSSTTEPMAVVAGGTFDGLTLSANSFINNNGNNATPLFSLNPVPKNNSYVNTNRVQGFTKGIILNCEYGNNTFTDKDESVQSTVNTTWKMEGLLCEFINRNAFSANSQYYALSFRNKTAEAAIVFETGSFSDLTRMRFYTQVGAALKEAMFLHNGEVGMPNLPISSTDAEIGGLYAGADGVVKIRRT